MCLLVSAVPGAGCCRRVPTLKGDLLAIVQSTLALRGYMLALRGGTLALRGGMDAAISSPSGVTGSAGELPPSTTRLPWLARSPPSMAAPPGVQGPAVAVPVMAAGGTASPPLTLACHSAGQCWDVARGCIPASPESCPVPQKCLPVPRAVGLRASQPKAELVRQRSWGPWTPTTLSMH